MSVDELPWIELITALRNDGTDLRRSMKMHALVNQHPFVIDTIGVLIARAMCDSF